MVSCGDPGLPRDATRIGGNFTFGENLTFLCSEGFTLRGKQTTYCLANRSWSNPPPRCTPVKCPKLDAPNYGSVNSSNVTFTTVVVFSCMSGFELVGLSGIRCQANGTWSASPAQCVPVKCLGLRPPLHGYIAQQNSSFRGLAKMRCLEGYEEAGGNRTRECLASKQWNGANLYCKGIALFG